MNLTRIYPLDAIKIALMIAKGKSPEAAAKLVLRALEKTGWQIVSKESKP